jgi:diguanylate cyclase (GGDEF)-like protein
MRIGEHKGRGGHLEREDMAEVHRGPLSWDSDLRSLLRRHTAPLGRSGPWRVAEEAFSVVLSRANRDLAELLRDLHGGQGAHAGDGSRCHSFDDLLRRAVHCALQQFTLQAELGALALTDGLTGLFNRRGFFTLAERQLKVARRSDRRMLLFLLDVDGLKAINDSFGHSEGDMALIRTAEALEKTFRESDILARFGGDEFAALAIEAAGHGEAAIATRLRQNLRAAAGDASRYELSLSMGVARFDPASGGSIGRLMVQADRAMYEHKRRGTALRRDARGAGLG